MANLLLPLLARGARATQERGIVRLARILGAEVVPAARAEAGTVGLLVYPRAEWEDFDADATDVDGPPEARIGLTGFAERADPGEVVVAPEVLGDERVVALWRVTDEGTLDVVATRYDPSPGWGSSFETLGALNELRKSRLRAVRAEDGCTRLRSPLSCAVAGCPHACKPMRWFDKRLNRPKYACVCTRVRSHAAP